ncbi:MAG: heavy-metal-associated domain-containing protein [Pseudobdellovibrionaceae bacterium]
MRTLFLSLILLTSPAFAAETMDLKIGNMTCEACAKSVRKAICSDPAIATCDVKVGSAHLVSKEGAKLDRTAIEKAIAGVGFTIEPAATATKK